MLCVVLVVALVEFEYAPVSVSPLAVVELLFEDVVLLLTVRF